MTSKNVLICLVGLPAAGKSYLCSSFISRPTLSYDIEYICYDDHIKAVDHLEDPSGWAEARQALNQNVSNLVQQKPASARNRILFLDDNFYYRGMRKEIFHIAQLHACIFGQVIFPICCDLSISNNALRNGSVVTNDTIRRMSRSIEHPSEAWEKHVLFLDNICKFDDSTLKNRTEKLEKFIEWLMEQPEEVNPRDEIEDKEEERKRTNDDVIQQCDILIRKRITQRIKEDKVKQRNVPYRCYRDAKYLLLGKLKSGEIEINDCSQILESTIFLQFDDCIDNQNS